jgi:magnesium transporter
VPSRASVEEIEATSRAYAEKGALYLSTSLPTRSHGSGPVDTESMPDGSGVTYVGFVLSEELLLTVRFAHMPAFDHIATRCRDEADDKAAPWDILLRIVEKIVDLTADRLEAIGAGLSEISHETFRAERAGDSGSSRRQRRSPAIVSKKLRGALRRLGTIGDMLWEVRDSLTGMLRIAHRLADEHSASLMGTGQPRVEPVMLDLKSLGDSREQLSGSSSSTRRSASSTSSRTTSCRR